MTDHTVNCQLQTKFVDDRKQYNDVVTNTEDKGVKVCFLVKFYVEETVVIFAQFTQMYNFTGSRGAISKVKKQNYSKHGDIRHTKDKF